MAPPPYLQNRGVVAFERLLWWLRRDICVAPQWAGGGLSYSLPRQDVAGNHPHFHLLGFRASALNPQPQEFTVRGPARRNRYGTLRKPFARGGVRQLKRGRGLSVRGCSGSENWKIFQNWLQGISQRVKNLKSRVSSTVEGFPIVAR